MRSATFITASLIFTAVVAATPHARAARTPRMTDRQYFDAVLDLAKRNDAEGVQKTSSEFFRLYPKSPLIPDVRLVLAEFEQSPEESIAKYRVLVDKYRYYAKRDYALYRICEIEFLLSRWSDCAEDARAGLKLPAGPHVSGFRIFLITSLIHLGEYGDAEQECRRLIEADHEYNTMARSLLILSHIYRNTTGLSRTYITTIRELAVGYRKSDSLPPTLYLLGEFYEKRGMFNESYSAYSDLVKQFPGAPEAARAEIRIAALKNHLPRRVSYLPGKEVIDAADTIDIRPETAVPESDTERAFYSISIGPFSTKSEANRIRGLLDNFNFRKLVSLRSGYALYVGRGADEDAIMKVKIRLAEEYGINGRIVRISGDGRRSYIYGE